MTSKDNLKEKQKTTKKNKDIKDIFFMVPYEPKEKFDPYDTGSEFDYIGEDY